MSAFIDVQPFHWYHKNIDEMYHSYLADGTPFLAGIPYNIFKQGKEAIDYEVQATQSFSETTLNFLVQPTEDNPLVVTVDGMEIAIDDIIPNTSNNTTFIKFSRVIPAGSTVRYFYAGEPKLVLVASSLTNQVPVRSAPSDSASVVRYLNALDTVEFIELVDNWYRVADGYVKNTEDVRVAPAGINTSGVAFPEATLTIPSGFVYYYDPYYGNSYECCKYLGTQMRRVENRSLITKAQDYAVENGKLYVHYSLNRSEIEFQFLVKNSAGVIKTQRLLLKPVSQKIIYYNRFFPELVMTRADFISLLNRLRKHFYLKYTDQQAPDNNKTTSRFTDVNNLLATSTPWWWADLRNIEDIRTEDGGYLFYGDGNGNFMPYKGITRAECVTIINKFRKVLVNAFK